MQTRLVRVIADIPKPAKSDSIAVDENTRSKRSWSSLAKIGLSTIAGSVGGVAIHAVKSGVDWWQETDKVQTLELHDAHDLHELDGKPPILNQIYAYHPNKSELGLIIPATEFYDDVVGEQITDLVSYIRSSVRTKELRISVYSEKAGKAGISSSVGPEVDFSYKRAHSVEAEYQDANLVESDRVLFWISEFPEVISLLKGNPKGRIKRVVSVDMTFGLDISIAKKVGMDVSWIGRQYFEIEATFI